MAHASNIAARLDTEAIRNTFAEDGYFVLPGVISKPVLESVTERLNREFSQWSESSESFKGGGLLSGHLNCYPGEAARGIMDELRDTGTLGLVQELFPTKPEQVRWGCNFNLPGSVEQHYHMDGVYLDHYVIVNVAVVDTTLHNGAIDMVPKTHKRFYKYWEFAARRLHTQAKRIPMSRGDVLVRLSTVWHRGMPNHSSAARPMLALTLGESYVDNPDPFSKNGGQVTFEANWFKTDLLGRLRERITVRAPVTYSSYRFAHSLVSNKGYETF